MLSQGLMKITGAKILGVVISPISAMMVIGGVIIWQNTQHHKLLHKIKKQDAKNNTKDIKARTYAGSSLIKKPDHSRARMFKQILDDNIALRAEPT
ncbi:MAG: hypothetical protein Q9M22_04275 [Mariprofundaceae bacterium]|nr:hypothetical protein [Mariprofundaceae bacterium]